MKLSPVVVTFLVLTLSGSALAQSTAVINGRIVDGAGAVLPGVTVTATNAGTGISRTTVTNEVGLFTVAALPVGRYEVRAELSGFAPASRPGIDLVAGSTVSVEFTLQLAQIAETVTVQAAAPLIQTTQSVVSSSIGVTEVQSLPILNRNFTSMVALVPGARPAPPHNPTKAAMGISVSFGGSAGRNVEVKVDGLDNRDDIIGGPMQNVTLEAIQEFTLLSHRFGAEYGRTAGAVLQIVTKAGTNQPHGSAFAIGRNDAMTATDFFTKQANGRKNEYTRAQLGGSLGGPIIRDKMFLFGALERTHQDYEQTFPERQYQEVLLLQEFGAKPIQTILYPLRDTTYTLRGDYQLNPSHGFFARWAHQVNSQDNDLIVPVGGGASAGAGHPDLSVETTDTNNMWSFVGSETWIIGNDAVNTFAVQVNNMSTINGIGDSVDAPINPTERNLFFPSVNIGQPSATTQQYAQRKVQIKNDFGVQRGRHSLKLGGDFGYYPDLAIILDIGLRGSLRFFDDPSTIVGSQRAWAANANTCTTARFVAGSTTACGPYRQGFRTPGAVQSILQGTRSSGGPLSDSGYVDPKQFSAYVQDDWRLNDRLTINMGVRYDLAINFLNEKELANSRVYQVLQAIESPYGALPETPKTNFSPRAGFAWDISGDGRTVLRGGSGVYFDQPSQSYGFGIARQSKETIAISNSYINSSVGVGQLADYVYGVSPLPAGPPPTPTELPRGGNTSGAWWDPDSKSPYSVQAHVGLARQLTETTALAVDFTHVRNYREFRFGGGLEINPIEGPWNPNADPAMYGRRRLVPALQRVFGDPALLGSVSIATTQSRSRFDELVIHLQQRAARAMFQASYTLANARGFGGCIGGGGGSSGGNCQGPQNQDEFLSQAEWGPTATDERHRIVLNGVFELPWGMQASPIFQAASGRPYTLTAGTDVNRDGTNNDRYVDPTTGQQVGLNSARGDATWNVDARVTKAFTFGGAGRKLDVFAEFYNITDRVNFGGYNGTATSVFFQQPTSYFAGYPPSRQLQVGGRFSF